MMSTGGMQGQFKRNVPIGFCVLALLTAPALASGQQTGTITGRVTSSTGQQPLSSVQISIEGTEMGTLTEESGRFVILNAPTGEQTVVAELIGYTRQARTVNVPPGGVAEVDFQLRQVAVNVEGLVVTGTPTATPRRQIGTQIGNVSASDVQELAPVLDANELISGRIPGAVVQTQSGNIGSGAPIRLRGNSTLSLSGDPLIYVDGIRVAGGGSQNPQGIFGHTGQSRLADFRPQDIESIEIIRGPAATALYGTEASNGVIQIITKSGAAEETTQFTFEMRQGSNWIKNAEERFPVNFDTDPQTGELVQQNLIKHERQEGRGDPFRQGHTQQYHLSARGGTGDIGYFISGAIDDQDGVTADNSLERFTGRANISAEVLPDLTVQSNLGIVTMENRRHPEGFSRDQSIPANVLFASPLTRDDPNLRGFFRAPPEETFDIVLKQELDRFTYSTTTTWDPTGDMLGWFSTRLNAGIDVADARNQELWPRQPEPEGHPFGDRAFGRKELQDEKVSRVSVDWNMSADLDVTDWINAPTQTELKSTFGIQFFRDKTELSSALATEFPAQGVTLVGSAAQRIADETEVTNKTFGLFLQEELSIADRYFVTGAVRADDNSSFGEGADAQVFPKVDAVWSVSDEPWFNVSKVNQLRIRGAWGRSGKQPSAFAANRTFRPVTGPNDEPIVLPLNPGNPQLKPEEGSELEFGADISLLNDRIGIQGTWFRQITEDAILEVPSAPSTGFTADQFINLGKVTNRGFEVQLNAVALERRDVSVQWDLQASYTKNRVDDLGGRPPILLGGFGTIWVREGFPAGSFFSKRVVQAEKQPDGSFTNVLCDGGRGKRGMESGGPAVPCDEAPLISRGSPGPNWTGSAALTVGFLEHFRFHAFMEFKADSRLFSITEFGRDAIFRNTLQANRPDAPREDPDAPGPRPGEEARNWPVTRQAEEALGFNGQWVQNNSFMRLQELSISVDLPEEWSGYIGGNRTTFNLAARNVMDFFVSDQFTDTDPNQFRGGNTFVRSVQTLLPQPTSIVGTVRVTW